MLGDQVVEAVRDDARLLLWTEYLKSLDELSIEDGLGSTMRLRTELGSIRTCRCMRIKVMLRTEFGVFPKGCRSP